MICPNCNCEINDSAQFCSKCGAKLESDLERETEGLSDKQFVVTLQSFGNDKIAVVKALKDFAQLDLRTAKKAVESAPCELATFSSKQHAETMVEHLQEAGAVTSITSLDAGTKDSPTILGKKAEFASFTQTEDDEQYDGYIKIDDEHKLVAFFPNSTERTLGQYGGVRNTDWIFQYKELLGYEVIEDNVVEAKGWVGRTLGGALVGAVAGPIGMAAGATIGASTRKTQNLCSNLLIRLTLKDRQPPTASICLIEKPVKRDSTKYLGAREYAANICAALDKIIAEKDAITCATKEPAPAPHNDGTGTAADTIDPVSELRRYKELLDEDIITQEDFNAKKKQLLRL